MMDALVRAPFASLKKQVVTLIRLIYCERKTLFRLKNKLKSTYYKRNERDRGDPGEKSVERVHTIW